MSRRRRFQAMNDAWERGSCAQNCAIVKPLTAWRRTRSRQSAWSWRSGFSARGRLLKRDGLVHLTGYRTPQVWSSRTLTQNPTREVGLVFGNTLSQNKNHRRATHLPEPMSGRWHATTAHSAVGFASVIAVKLSTPFVVISRSVRRTLSGMVPAGLFRGWPRSFHNNRLLLLLPSSPPMMVVLDPAGDIRHVCQPPALQIQRQLLCGLRSIR
jgi:hypothetical protein